MKNRVGERKVMKCGEECEVVEYRNYSDVTIRFLNTGELVNCRYSNFKKGLVKSRFTPSVFGVGAVGDKSTIGEDGQILKSYICWKGMLKRCYSGDYKRKNPTYEDCIVCEGWLIYSNFKKWFDKNYYEVGDEVMCLDKDILSKGNKIYSPETCVFVPNNINVLFLKNDANRGDLPIGVCWQKQSKKYQAQCKVFDSKNNKYNKKYLGLYSNTQEAFNTYKKAKEENIKLVADHYKEQIPKKLYDAMCKYEIEIED